MIRVRFSKTTIIYLVIALVNQWSLNTFAWNFQLSNDATPCLSFATDNGSSVAVLQKNYQTFLLKKEYCEAAEAAWNLSKKNPGERRTWQVRSLSALYLQNDYAATIGEGLRILREDTAAQSHLELRLIIIKSALQIANKLGPERDPTFLYYVLGIHHQLLPSQSDENIDPRFLSLSEFIEKFKSARTQELTQEDQREILTYPKLLDSYWSIFVERELKIAESLRLTRPALVFGSISRMNALNGFPQIRDSKLILIPTIQRTIFIVEFVRLLYPSANNPFDVFNRDAVLIDPNLVFGQAFPNERLLSLNLPGLNYNEKTRQFNRQEYACRLLNVVETALQQVTSKIESFRGQFTVAETEKITSKMSLSRQAHQSALSKIGPCSKAN